MRLLAFIMLFILPLNLLAAESIFTWGYGAQADGILKSVAAMTAGSGDYSLRLVAALGLFVFAFRIMVIGKDNVLQEFSKYMLITTLVGYMFWISKHDYIVEDQINGFTSTNPINLPVGVGTTLSIFSGIEKGVGEGMEKYFSTPTTLGMMKNGLGFQMNVNLSANGAALQDPNLIRGFYEYIGNCVMPAIQDGALDQNKIFNSDNLYSDLAVNNSLLTNTYSGTTSTTDTCANTWPVLQAGITADYPSIMATIGAITPGGTNASFATDVGQVFKTMYNNAGNSAQNGITQAALTNALSSGITSSALATGGDASSLALSKAITDQSLKAGWSQTGIAAQKTLPLQKAVFTLVLMGLIFIMALMSIVFVTIQYVKTIFMLFAVLVLWNPIAAIINYLISMQLDSNASQILAATGGKHYPTYMTSNIISSTATDYMAFLGFFATLIPMFAYMLVKGGDSIASHMYSSIAGSMSMAARTGGAAQGTGVINTNSVGSGGRQFSNETIGNKNTYTSNFDGSVKHDQQIDNGILRTESNPLNGSTSGGIYRAGDNGSGGAGSPFSRDTHDATNNIMSKSIGGKVVSAMAPSISSGQITQGYTESLKEGYNAASQEVTSKSAERLKMFSEATKDSKNDQEMMQVIEGMGVKSSDASQIVRGIKDLRSHATDSTNTMGGKSSTTQADTNTTTVGGGVDAGTPGQGPVGAKVSTGASKNKVNQSTTTNESGHTTAAKDTTATSTTTDSTAAHLVSKDKDLREALARSTTGSHVHESGTTDSLADKNAEQLSSAYSKLQAYDKALSTADTNTQNTTVAALNDYFHRKGIDTDDKAGADARQAELERLNASFASGNGANELEWKQSLKNVANKVTGMNPDSVTADPNKLVSKGNIVEHAADALTPPDTTRPGNVNPHLTAEDKNPLNQLYANKLGNHEKPSAAPVVTQEFKTDQNKLANDKEIISENYAADRESKDKKYNTNIYQDVVQDVAQTISDEMRPPNGAPTWDADMKDMINHNQNQKGSLFNVLHGKDSIGDGLTAMGDDVKGLFR